MHQVIRMTERYKNYPNCQEAAMTYCIKIIPIFTNSKQKKKGKKREAFQEYWSYIVQSESSLTKSCLFFLRNQ